jgi:hypothetical protein
VQLSQGKRPTPAGAQRGQNVARLNRRIVLSSDRPRLAARIGSSPSPTHLGILPPALIMGHRKH